MIHTMTKLTDSLAKADAKDSPFLVDLNYQYISDALCFLTWNNNYIINQDSRKWLDGPLQA